MSELTKTEVWAIMDRVPDLAQVDEDVLRRLMIDVDIESAMALERVVAPVSKATSAIVRQTSDEKVLGAYWCLIISTALIARGLQHQADLVRDYVLRVCGRSAADEAKRRLSESLKSCEMAGLPASMVLFMNGWRS